MVMITRSAYRKAGENSNNSEISQNNIIDMPPWCSSGNHSPFSGVYTGKVYERRKPRKALPSWEAQTSNPLRENIWEYLNDKSGFFDGAQKTRMKKIKPHRRVHARTSKLLKMAVCFLVGLAFIVPFWIPEKLPQAALLKSILKDVQLVNFVNLHCTSGGEECCDRIRYLTLALSRIEQELRNAVRLRRKLMLNLPSNKTKTTTNNVLKGLIHGAKAIKGSRTKEWGARVALWGVIPLWRTAPPPDTILALRQSKPSDCWPFSGSYGEVIIELPRKMSVGSMSLEHVRPDTARSAPKNFIVYGVLENGTYVKAADGLYKYNKPAKQYFSLNNRNAPFKRIVFRVLSNQGNVKYTCIYRVHVYESDDNTFIF